MINLPLSSQAYNYDDTYQKGIKLHGDEAAVNCNLWITPDDANLDEESGGACRCVANEDSFAIVGKKRVV